MSQSEDVKFGEPFFFGVCDANTNGYMDDFAVDGHPGVSTTFKALQEHAVRDVLQYGGRIVILKSEPMVVVDVDYARAFAQLTDMDVEEGDDIDETDGVPNA